MMDLGEDERMMTLTEFVEARLAEDVVMASGASPGPWAWDEGYMGTELRGPSEDLVVGADGQFSYEGSVSIKDADATHIARHDPPRVLREVEAKRAILEIHGRRHECRRYVQIGDEVDNCQWTKDGYDWPCATLEHLASVYADHADFDEAWRP